MYQLAINTRTMGIIVVIMKIAMIVLLMTKIIVMMRMNAMRW